MSLVQSYTSHNIDILPANCSVFKGFKLLFEQITVEPVIIDFGNSLYIKYENNFLKFSMYDLEELQFKVLTFLQKTVQMHDIGVEVGW